MSKADSQPLVEVCYDRWRGLPWPQVLDEMAVLFHLAMQIDDVARLDKVQRQCLANERCAEVPCPCGFWESL